MSKPEPKTKNPAPPAARAAQGPPDAGAALAPVRAAGMLLALGAAVYTGWQAGANSDLLAGAIRGAIVWASVAGVWLTGTHIAGLIMAAAPTKPTEPLAPAAPAKGQG